MKADALMMLAVLLPSLLRAAPAAKTDPVADGFPDWQGISDKNYVCGREICPSDLRHKVTVVLEIEPGEKLQDQLVMAAPFGMATGLVNMGFGANWEDAELPRNVIFVVSNRGNGGSKEHESILESLKYKGDDTQRASELRSYQGSACSIYDGVTFTGAPDSTGKRPYVYVMGPTGKEPLYQGALDAAGVKAAQAAIAKGKKEIDGWENKWQPFYGNIPEPKYLPILAKTLEKGKTAKMAPLKAAEAAALKNVLSKDEEKAKEGQILFDAMNQTRSDLVLRIQMEAGACPHRAYYDIETLLKYWPVEKKRLEAAYAKLKANPEAEMMGKMFCKLVEWSKPEFTCKNASEAKKIVQNLNKIKKSLEKLKESKNITIQNGALLLDMKVDELISAIPAKVATK